MGDLFIQKRRKKQVCSGGAGWCGGEGIHEAGLAYLEGVTAGDGESTVHRYWQKVSPPPAKELSVVTYNVSQL